MDLPNTPPPGWYPDPANSNMQRYWDGLNWTSETRMPAPDHPPGAPSGDIGPSYAPPSYGGSTSSSSNYNSYTNNFTPNSSLDRPNNYLAWAIVVTILCCWPLGIPSIVFAARVNSLWDQGKSAEALEASKKAKTWAIVAGVAGVVIYSIVFLLAAIGEYSTSGSNNAAACEVALQAAEGIARNANAIAAFEGTYTANEHINTAGLEAVSGSSNAWDSATNTFTVAISGEIGTATVLGDPAVAAPSGECAKS